MMNMLNKLYQSMQTRVMMQNLLKINSGVNNLDVAFPARIIPNLLYQRKYKTITTKQDLWQNDSLLGSKMGFIEQELDMR